jgi:ABC-type transporter Mla subunit MlaD
MQYEDVEKWLFYLLVVDCLTGPPWNIHNAVTAQLNRYGNLKQIGKIVFSFVPKIFLCQLTMSTKRLALIPNGAMKKP